MKNANNATCSICGSPYYLCKACSDTRKINPWKLHTDTAEHYKIYQIIHGLSTGVYTKADAKSRFANVDLSDLDNLRENIKAIIKDILEYSDDTEIKNVVEETESKSSESKVSFKNKKKNYKNTENNATANINECE